MIAVFWPLLANPIQSANMRIAGAFSSLERISIYDFRPSVSEPLITTLSPAWGTVEPVSY